MNSIFAVLVNEVPQLEYDRTKILPEHQLQFLEKMDRELAVQIVMGDDIIKNPTIEQRAQFVAINLANALREGKDNLAAAMCSYLAVRIPDLKQVRVKEMDNQCLIDLVYDEAYVRQVSVSFQPRNNDKPH